MKNISKIICVGLIVILSGCNDAIDITQPGRLSAENAFRTVDDLQQGLLALYNQVDITPAISLSANFTDEVAVGFDSGGQGFALYDFVLNAGSAAAADFWVRNLRVNNRATILIEAAELVEPGEGEQAAYNDILAQAYAIRAFANTEMLLHFSPDPADDSSLGIPVIDFVAPLDIQPRRATTGESWDYILSDLQKADDLTQSNDDVFFIGQDAIDALRSRIALNRKNYPLAGQLASELISKYDLADRDEYLAMWLDQDNTEVIWKLQRTLNDAYDGQVNTGSVATGGGWAGSIFAFVDATITGSPYFEIDRGLFNLLDPEDIRYDVIVAPTSIINPDYATDPDPVNTDILVIQKYPGSEGQPLMNDLKIFRISEQYLILAEARAAANDLSGAAQAIDAIRDARFGEDMPAPVYSSQTEAYQDILEERRIELAFEGFRYVDLKRLGPAAGVGIDRDLTDCTNQSGACTLPATDYRFALPIPIVEINANPGISEQQNPGY